MTVEVTRRRLLGVASAGALAGAAGLAAGQAVSRGDDATAAYPFHGEHQAGILTPAQDRLHFAAFDVTTTSRSELVALLREWTEAAARLTRGEPLAGEAPYDAPPSDTGEALGLSAAGLTLTFGFGPSLFDGRFGLAGRRPQALERLPHFPADNLDPRRSDGDLCVQACANDPQVAVHAIRNLARIGFGRVAVRWAQLGYGRTSATTRAQSTPRNLMGFKDGTRNLRAEDHDELDRFVWVGGDDDPRAGWLAGGSYLVARRINIRAEQWDRTTLREQEALIGRDRAVGAPLSGGTEFTAPAVDRLAPNSHVRLAHPDSNDGVRIMRRGYNFTDGSDALGRLDTGLFFLAFVRDPARQYVPMQARLSREDGLMEYLEHTGSGLWAVPPGVARGEYVGQALFS